MSILIKGISKPPSCWDCPVYPDYVNWCGCDYENCPAIIELPPHGRLIDADALKIAQKPIGKLMMYGGEYVYTQTAIDEMPTIIEAEEGEGCLTN